MKAEAIELYKQLTAEWEKAQQQQQPHNQNAKNCVEILKKLKLIIIEMGFIPAYGSKIDKQELHLTRDVLEIGALCSIAVQDIPSFERYISQLKTFYFDFKDQINESPFKYQIIGLNLLCLLARNRLAEFHTELELLSPTLIQSNIYIRHPVSLEQYLMEGSYNKVFLSKGNVPARSYNFFMDILLRTIREEIASCIEAAYKRILVSEAKNMLYLKADSELAEFAKEREWKPAGDNFFYFKQAKSHDATNQTIPSNDMVMQMIDYAKELEIIV